MYNNPYVMPNYAQMYGQNNQNYMQQPTYPQMPQQNVQQSVSQNVSQPVVQRGLQGKIVESLDIVKSTEIPMDGSVTYFPLVDGSGIVTKQLTSNGTSKITIFKAIGEEKEEVKSITLDDLKSSLDELKNRNNDDIIKAIDDLKKELKKKGEK